ncbi:MAG TPA: hypothetical protein VEJ20_09970, partial [Candidatus Eremiobacteraceae bacterium]|nr:hypothetical protein [Candidatus Eremiobacteraceae bacterium]
MDLRDRLISRLLFIVVAAAALSSCGGGSGSGSVGQHASPTPGPGGAQLPNGFSVTTIASVASARELAALPNGDLLVGTEGSNLYLVPGAENAGAPGAAHVFITLPDSPAQGVAISPDGTTIYAATQYYVYEIAYHTGDQTEPNGSAVQIAAVRQGPISPGSDGDVHHTSSVAVTATTVYVGVGSSCNACVEVDPTRATIQAM